ncbi:unnamed protein product [Symbiodinium sp. KB8]|nr:unnamed protein product [Symbiodinium sp. KB8]
MTNSRSISCPLLSRHPHAWKVPLAARPLANTAHFACGHCLTQETFAKTIQRGQRALVAFVTPWCLACRLLMAELEKLHEALQPQVLVAQCDVSKETGLANLYSAWRTPLVVLFPDTEVLLPGLQVIYAGQMHYSSLLSFANAGPWPPQLRSPLDLEEVVRESGRAGTFVGFFRSPEAAGHLQDLWPLDCLRRHNRAFTFARWANETDRNQSRGEEELWRWAGLGARKALRIKEVQEGQLLKQEIELDSNTGSADLSPVEAVVYVRADEDACQFAPSDKYVMYQEGGSSSSSARISPSSWRERVDAFCAWCERQVLGPVAVFDAPRAAALDGTFDWLLLLFAPKDVTEDQEGESGFLRERRRLERFTSAACAKDRRYGEVLPVIVPWGGEEAENISAKLTVFSYSAAMSVCERAGQWQKGLQILQQMKAATTQADVVVYNAAISTCGHAGQWERSMALFKELQDEALQCNVISCNSVISACERAGNWTAALGCFEDLILSRRLQADAISYNSMITALAAAGRWQHAMQMLDELQRGRIRATVVTCSAVMAACEAAGCWEEALQLFGFLLKESVQANQISYNSAISVCETCGAWHHALLLATQMGSCAVGRDQITYNSALSAAPWHQAASLLSEAAGRCLRASVITLNSSIDVCGAAAQWQQALRLLDSPAGQAFDVITFNSTVSAMSSVSWESSCLLMAAMQRQVHKSDIVGYTAAISSCEEVSLWYQAAFLLADMAKQQTRVDSLSVSLVVGAFEKNASWQQTLSFLHDQRTQLVAVNILTYNLVMATCLDASEWQRVLALFRTLGGETVRANAITYSFCVEACDNGGHLKGQDSPVFARDLHSAGFEALRELRKKRQHAHAHDILAFRASFGLGPQDPALPLPRQGEGGDLRTGCHALQDADNEDTEPGRRRRLVLFATSLFNTRTRRKYPAPGGAGWCPGDELALCLFTDAVLDGKVLPQIRSTKRFPEPDVASPRVKELFGSSVEVEVLQAVAQRRAEVLMLVYAPFCSHSLHFFALWRQVSDAMHAMTGPSLNASAPVLQMAQMDGMQNEHPELPPIRQFPTLLLCLPKETGAADVLSSSVVFKQYQGPGNLAAILSWISRNSAVAPRVVGVEGLS